MPSFAWKTKLVHRSVQAHTIAGAGPVSVSGSGKHGVRVEAWVTCALVGSADGVGRAAIVDTLVVSSGHIDVSEAGGAVGVRVAMRVVGARAVNCAAEMLNRARWKVGKDSSSASH